MSAWCRVSRLSVAVSTLVTGLTLVLMHEPASAGPGAQAGFGVMGRGGPGEVNHPVNVIPSPAITIPGGWPVDSSGAITCLTCHATLPDWNGSSGPNLREDDPESSGGLAFCAKCHGDDSGQAGDNMHWTVMGAAHIHLDDDGTHATGLLDTDSQRCLGCHDGVSARDFGFTAGYRGTGEPIDLRHTHPVGIPYKTIGTRGRNARLRPAMLLPPQVRLPSGRVSCISCHNLYATDPSRLAVPIENSRLCFSCHDMD